MDEEIISLFKVARTGIWYIQYTDSEGNRVQKSTRCARQQDALKKLADFKYFIRVKSKDKSPSLSTYIADYLRHIGAAHSKSTFRSYNLALRHFVRIVSDISIGSITPRHWDLYKTIRLKEKKPVQRKFKNPEDTALALQSQKNIAATTDGNSAATNESRFSALPGGNYNNVLPPHFFNIGEYTGWWSSTEDDNTYALGYFLSARAEKAIKRNYGTKTYGFSVRCLKD